VSIDETKVKSILDAVRYATISTVDGDGLAWAAPVWYVFDDSLNIYWWSSINSQHSINIQNSSNIYVTVFDSTLPEGEGLGVFIRADAREVGEHELQDAMALYNESTQVFKMSEKNCTNDAPTRMYVAVPSEIWMNDGDENDGYWQDFRKKVKK
jgi:uncharacterized protein YhbP (UPF0306 family)